MNSANLADDRYDLLQSCLASWKQEHVLQWWHELNDSQRKQLGRKVKRLNSMLTPMCKYYASEMCCTVADTAVQVLG